MITPNLATRPFLNTRPVWIVTIVAGLAAVILLMADLRLVLVANRALDDDTARRDALVERHRTLENELRGDIAVLERVPWRSLTLRVNATNVILREHAFSWLGMLDDIEGVMPYGVRLTKIAPIVAEDEVTLSLSLIAQNRDAMLELLDNFVADPKFSEPTPFTELSPEETSSATYVMNLRVTYLPSQEAP